MDRKRIEYALALKKELQEREAELVEAIKAQKLREANRVVKTPEEKSALANTQEAADISGESPSSSDPDPERTIIPDPFKLRQEADSAQREAVRQEGLAESYERLAQSNDQGVEERLARGDNRGARLSQASANRFRAKSVKAGEAAEAATQVATFKRQAAQDNEALLDQRATLN